MNIKVLLFSICLKRLAESIQLCPFVFCNSTRYKSHCQIECSSPNGEFPPLGSSKFKKISKINFSNINQIPAYSFEGKFFWEVTINSENLDSISDNAFCRIKRLDSLNILNPKRLDIFYSNSVDCLKVLIKNFYLKSSILNDLTFTKLLEKIGSFKNLVNLSLSDTNVNSINLNGLSNLINFSILSSPVEKFKISKNLKSLEITLSNIKKLEKESFEGSKLKHLNFSHNRIETLEKGLFPITLENIYLNNNKISTIQSGWIDKFNNIKILDLSFNLIEFLPLENLNNLEHLNVQFNMIKNLDFFSKSNFDQLKTLILSNNKIYDFPSHILINAKNLVKLDFSMNLIENIQFPQMDHLKFINFSNNRITRIHGPVFSLLSSLEVADLSFNRIKNFESILNSKFLEKIILINNMLNKIPSFKRLLGNVKPDKLIVDLVSNNISRFNKEDLCDLLNFINITFVVDGFSEHCLLNESKILNFDNTKLRYSKIQNIQVFNLNPLSYENFNCTISSNSFQDQCLNYTTPIKLNYSENVISSYKNHSFNESNSTGTKSNESQIKNFAIIDTKFNILNQIELFLIFFLYFNFFMFLW